MLVEVYGDFACPWCYVGMRRFRQALDGFPEAVRRVHRPFQLDGDRSGPAVPLEASLVEQFGGGAKQMLGAVAAAGAEVGIGFRFDRALSVNTLDAHRVAWLAERDGYGAEVRERLAEGLFAASFVDGRDLGDHEVLAEVAMGAGLDGDRVAEGLASGEGVTQIREAVAQARVDGVAELPTYVFPGGERLVSSVPSSEYRRLLDSICLPRAR